LACVPSRLSRRIRVLKRTSQWSRFAALALSVYLSYFLVFRVLRVYIKDRIIDASNPLEGYCAHVAPIVRDEYLGRQDALAQTLHAVGGSAYIAEPGASAAYFANLTGRAWGLSERPLLLIVSHDFDVEGAVVPTVTVLTPTFEESRARQLNITAGRVRWAAWDEDANPYAAALSALPAHARTKDAKIFVDGAVRHFVVDGLQKVMPDARVLVAPKEVRQLRERKSPKELEILTCANEASRASPVCRLR
jgi:Xaa-Pro aminopeptidase